MPNFSAQVVLHPGLTEGEVARVLQAFLALGFQTGPVVGENFSIEGSGDRFTSVFSVRLKALPSGGVAILGAPTGTPKDELPLTALPVSLQSLVGHVLFTDPPAFGPGGVFSESA